MFNADTICKQKIMELPSVYTASALMLGETLHIAGGSELRHPSALFNFDTGAIEYLSDVPGGVMSILPVPGHPHCLVSVMGLFPPFIGEEGGVFLHVRRAGGWSTRKVAVMPFAHRAEIIQRNGINHLIAATVSRRKEFPDDWREAGEVFHQAFDDPERADWNMERLCDDIVKNHGMGKRGARDWEVVYVSGVGGIDCIAPGAGAAWMRTRIFDKEVSEFMFADLNGDGIDELITIEPFHGDSLNVYRKIPGGWCAHYRAPLSFGHGLSAGNFKGTMVVAVGNRRGAMALELHAVREPARLEIETIVVECGVAPTQVKLFTHHGSEYLLSANQLKNEIVLYS